MARSLGLGIFPVVVLTMCAVVTATLRPVAGQTQPIRDFLQRIIPAHAAQFVCETIPANDGKDVFELESKDGKIVLCGNSPLSQAVALNWYLKYYLHCHVSRNGQQLNLPAELPMVREKVRQVGWARSRYLINYVAFGYVHPWWNWEQWEQFIDWMALNGVNMPLAITGQEAVWQAVGKRFGMTDAELGAFLPGPPYLPFCWMGCLDGRGGPLPSDWIPKHIVLEQRILARERELGMTPVLQGFTGHLPKAIADKFPGTNVQKIHWFGFDTWMLDPTDPLFQRLGTAWIEEQTRLFGTNHLYAADSFIEMTPPSGEREYLSKIGRGIYNGMADADPKAIWLFQSWAFIARDLWGQQPFWTPDRIKAFLDAVSNDRMLILDLYCDVLPGWKKAQGFYGKPWVWSFVYNFGDNTVLGGAGSITRFNDLADVRKDPLGHNVRGVGIIMEGYNHDPLFFDIMYELAWRSDVDLKSWVQEYSRFRYGKQNADAQTAWETLRTRLYNMGVGTCSGKSVLVVPPALTCSYFKYPAPALADAWRLLLHAAPELSASETYRHDLVNVARQSLSNHAGTLYQRAMEAYRAKDSVLFQRASSDFLQLIRDLDALLASSDQFLLGTWLENAKRWGSTSAERARMEWNARRILTAWDNNTIIRDYAAKEWSGLLAGFYEKRWTLFFRHVQKSLDSGKPFDAGTCQVEIYRFENDWCNATERYPTTPHGDSIAVSRQLYKKCYR